METLLTSTAKITALQVSRRTTERKTWQEFCIANKYNFNPLGKGNLMATTYTTPANNTLTTPRAEVRSPNRAMYWAIGAAVVLAIVLFFAMRNNVTTTEPINDTNRIQSSTTTDRAMPAEQPVTPSTPATTDPATAPAPTERPSDLTR